jgi:hypothetical protein
MNGQNVDDRRNYPMAATRHTGVNNATEGVLERDIAGCEARLRPFDDAHAAQTGLYQRMLVREFEDRHQRTTLWPLGMEGAYPKRLTPSRVHRAEARSQM